LTLDQKKDVISDIAQLGRLKFYRIGCLGLRHRVSPPLYRMGDGSGRERTCEVGPFESTLEYLRSFLNPQTDGSKVSSEIEAILESHMSTHHNSPSITAPFRLIHADVDAQYLNIYWRYLRQSGR
jgi:hypothetical protein